MPITVKDAFNVNQVIETANVNGRAAAAASSPVVLATEDLASIGTIIANQLTNVFYNESASVSLAISTTLAGTTRDTGIAAGTNQPYSYFNAFFLGDQAATVRIEASNNGSTWYTVASSLITANTAVTLTTPVMTRYHRATVVNGTTAQTALWVNSGYTGS